LLSGALVMPTMQGAMVATYNIGDTMRETKSLVRGSAIAAGLLLGATGAAQAQSVTLYGRVDLGVQYTSELPGGGDESEVYNGGIRPSIFGLKGSEDLGGGMKALFNLESHFSADTGTTTNRFWRRQANVGLSGGFGTVLLGVQYTPAVLALLATDPRAIKEQMSGLYPFALNQNGGAANNDLGIFMADAISYSNTLGPLNFGIAFGAADGGTGGRIGSAGASYSAEGGFKASAYYHQVDNNGSGALGDDRFSRQFGVGVKMPLGPVALSAQYIGSKVDDPTTAIEVSDTNTFGVGVDYAWSGSNTATLAYYHSKNKAIDNDKAGTLIISNDYALSKRTTLYAQLAVIDAKSGATSFTSATAAAVAPDETNTIFGVGISHNF